MHKPTCSTVVSFHASTIAFISSATCTYCIHRPAGDECLPARCGMQWPIFNNSNDFEARHGDPANPSEPEAGTGTCPEGRDCLHRLAQDIVIPEALGCSLRSLCSVMSIKWFEWLVSGLFCDGFARAHSLPLLPLLPAGFLPLSYPPPATRSLPPSIFLRALLPLLPAGFFPFPFPFPNTPFLPRSF